MDLEAAVAAAIATPDDASTWDTIEGLAEEHDRPDDVAAAYLQVLEQDLPTETLLKIGERAAQFHEEWYGDDPKRLEGVLMRILEIDAKSEWALQRLTVVYTVAQRWNDLLEVYDRATEVVDDQVRKIQLLEEAAQVAKDVAGQPEKAISYLQKLRPLRPHDAKLAHSLERLLEKHELWRDLIELWNARLDGMSREDREHHRVRIAACWLDNLGEPGEALAALRKLLAEASNDKEACELLERILSHDLSTADVRAGALELLTDRYESTERPREVVRVLELAIKFADAKQIMELHESAGERLATLGDDVAAMEHYAALLVLQPESTSTQEHLREIAQHSDNFKRYAEGVAAAAEHSTGSRRVALLTEAARTRVELLQDPNGAIDLYNAAMAQEDIESDDMRNVARRLNELLARADRPQERLDVLERLCSLETATSVRKAVIGETARLAETLGETDRALIAWQARIQVDPEDRAALDALIALVEKEERWEHLISALTARIAHATAPGQKRADMTRIARTYADNLNDPEQAIEAWRRVTNECGEDSETVQALTDLLERTERWQEFVELLDRVALRETGRTTARLVRLADARRANLGEPKEALERYRDALRIDAKHEGARTGMTALLEVEECAGDAAEALAESYRGSQEWERYLETTDARVAAAGDMRVRLGILREAATIREETLEDKAGALALLARAMPLDPNDRALEQHILTLAQETDSWALVGQAYHLAAFNVLDDPHNVARLRFQEAGILERDPDKESEALAAYMAVCGIEPDNLPAVRGVVRVGTRLGAWAEAAATVMGCTVAREAIDESLFSEMEAVAEEREVFDALTEALTTSLANSPNLPPRLAFDVQYRIAKLHRDKRSDAEAAQGALKAALAHRGDSRSALKDLADLQQAEPNAEYYDTLRRLGDLEPELSVRYQAALVALEHVEDTGEQVASVRAVLAAAKTAWRTGVETGVELSAAEIVSWALDRLVDRHCSDNEGAAAVDLLVDSSRLPFDNETKRNMRLRAAGITTDLLNDPAGAIDMYRAVLALTPQDSDTSEKLATLYQSEDRITELLTLRKRQLDHTEDAEGRLGLRLEVVALVGEIERRGGRLEALLANLNESPGHLASIVALTTLMHSHGQHEKLTELLEEQATRLEGMEQLERSAALWAQIAQISENDTKNIDMAINSHRRVVSLAPSPTALSALARLYVEQDRPAMAVPWLEQSLATAEGEQREILVRRLADAHLGAEQTSQAIGCLETYLGDEVPATELRAMLAGLYREGEIWQPLAGLLTTSLPHVDDETAKAYAREAAEIFHERLKTPEKAVPALQKALEFVPGDRTLRTMLATGLRVAERYDEARELLGQLIKDFGRRRSAERAAVHVELALVAKAEGNHEEALEQFELASKMDVNNASIQKMVGDLARENGRIDDAERTYRALLLVVRRQPPGDDEEAVGVSEVLYDLHKIAEGRGETDKAKELLETALETAVQSDAEVRRLRRALLAYGEAETLMRALQLRLESSDEAHSQAFLLIDLADVLDNSLSRSEDALDAQLKAMALVPDRLDLHDKARELARKVNNVDKYATAVESVTEHLRRKQDGPLVATLLMKAGDALEVDAGELAEAAKLYRRVEATGERQAEAYFAIARVAGAMDDHDEQTRALEELLQIATAEPDPNVSISISLRERVDALYRIAEVFVESDERRQRGIELLQRAFKEEPRFDQASATLRKAAEADPTNAQVLTVYERVARASTNWETLLDFLERRARLEGATPADVKEAVDLANEHELPERGNALLARAVDSARAGEGGIGDAIWAVVALAAQHAETEEFQAARDLFFEIADVAPAEQVATMGLSLAGQAAGAEMWRGLSAEIYELLRERDPSNREIWLPLVNLYREMGDNERLEYTINTTLPTLIEPASRNALRMEHAQHLVDAVKDHDRAVEVLRDVLLDNPDHLEGAAMLEQVLRAKGDTDGLADFLWQRFDEAKQRGNPETVGDVAYRLGTLLDETGSPDAVNVYRSALELAPTDRNLLNAVIEHLGEDDNPWERGALMERLLAVEEPEAAAPLTGQLIALWESLEDGDAVRRTLELGFQRCPSDTGIRERLENWYREVEAWPQLAAMIATHGESIEDDDAAVARMREGATLFSETCHDPSSAAAVLHKAMARAPHNQQVIVDLINSLTTAGSKAEAVAVLSQALSEIEDAAPRAELLLLRADLLLEVGEEARAIEDLEEAHSLDPASAAPKLMAGLEQQRARASEMSDRETERSSTLRLSTLLQGVGQDEPARDLLFGWVQRESKDREALCTLRDMDTATQNWEGVIFACSRLVMVEEGAEQIEAAVQLASASQNAEMPESARRGLEMVYEAQPESGVIRDHLRKIYELSGAHHEYASLLLSDAEHAEDDDTKYDAYRRAAEVFLHGLGDANAAIGPAEKARELRPNDHSGVLLYVDVLTGAYRTEEAGAILETAIAGHKRRSPELGVLQQRMSKVAAVNGDREGQLAWLKKAFDVDRKNGEIAAELAQLAYEAENYDLALKPLRAITLMDNPGPISRVMALLWEARIEHMRGNNAKAELWAKKALREDPNFVEAQEFLTQITQ